MSDNLKPQLRMQRPTLAGLPPQQLPPGVTLRSYQDGDDAVWDGLLRLSFGADTTVRFAKTMAADPCYSPDRVLFLELHGKPVATTSAYHKADVRPTQGMVHYVAGDPAAKGLGLGRQIVLAALHHMAREGRSGSWLGTDDFRLPAIKIYLDLGFEPVLLDENQRERWATVLRNLGRPELIETFAPILTGPVVTA